ncbi:MAG: hypothetical protein FWE80_07725 [Oscillospiraceae bacterium]|nr:hypothetical protein [Oscillospiraceae bacterium]
MDDQALLQAIRTIVKEETRTIVQDEIEPVTMRLDNLEGRFDNLEGRFDSLEQDVLALRKDMAYHNHEVLPLMQAIKDGLEGWQDRGRQVDRLDEKVEEHDIRLFALEQLAAVK